MLKGYFCLSDYPLRSDPMKGSTVVGTRQNSLNSRSSSPRLSVHVYKYQTRLDNCSIHTSGMPVVPALSTPLETSRSGTLE